MKRVRCPKCDHYTFFDETKYAEGQSLVFVCEECKKQFGIRIGVSKLRNLQKEENPDKELTESPFGSLTVVENVFAFKQVLPLHEGDNLIGRRSKGDDIDVPIESADPSLDRRHCYISVKRSPSGALVYTLRDNQSTTGTFLQNRLLGNRERAVVEEGAVITLGATTLILRTLCTD